MTDQPTPTTETSPNNAKAVETRKTESAGAVVVNAKGDVLVVSQEGNSWSLPKGHIEPGEEQLQAATREVHEESGLSEMQYVKKLGVYSRYKIGADGVGEDMSELKTMHMFLFKTSQENLQPIDPKNPEARWVKPENVAALLTHPKDREFYTSILEDPEFIFLSRVALS